ncbi:hypothetical protein [Marinobacter zhanjiangensis]|uniref:Lipoprotein n=1 Tax=Marinobacter zhanjiangensis TaxID=578215 RepID=A0ABQ3B2A7_9GAMM|nr:hypothetical protein [Marinobacter zhanjiangensis]GGY74607.1 hypothetical protein GCM10007071_22200 [Marinobacter zhanjiangensis]
MDFSKLTLALGFLVSGFLLTGCDATANTDKASTTSVSTNTQEGPGNTELNGQFEYELRSEEASVQDDRFPFGYWEVTRVYPEIVSASHPSAANAANQRIDALVHQARCEDMGDEAFHAREIYLGNGILSMAYEAVWTCASMPSPESETGFLNLDLVAGSELDLEAQFRDRDSYESFQERAVEALNHELEAQMAGKSETCPEATSITGFHFDGKNLWAALQSGEEGTATCSVKVSFAMESLQEQLKPISPLRLEGQP